MSSRKLDGVRLGIEEITPERALDLLTGNTENRTIRKAKVAEYARDMLAGNWKPGAGDPVHIAPGPLLGNGQHRLYAVVEADVPVSMSVLYAPRDYRQVADQGVRRTFGDVLRVTHKIGRSDAYGSCVRMLREYRQTGEVGRKMKYSAAELMETYEAEPNLANSMVVHMRESSRRSLRRTGINPTVATVMHYLFSEIDPGETEAFFESLQTGVGLQAGDPILAARRFFGNEIRREPRTHAAALIKAFNAWRAGKEMSLLVWKGGGSSPEPFPKIAPPTPSEEG